MFQGSEAVLTSVQADFNAIKALAQTEKALQQDSVKAKNRETGKGHTEERDIPTEENTDPINELESAVSLLKQSVCSQEVELVELKELVHTITPEPTQQLKEQLGQLKEEFRASLKELRGEVQGLQEDRETLRRELATVREELLLSERTVHSLREDVSSLQASSSHHAQLPTPQPSMSTATTSTTTQVIPPTPHSMPGPSSTQTHTTGPSSPLPTESDTPKPQKKAKAKTNKHTDADIVILIDSNGKFINEQQLFPGRRVAKIWCARTDDALQLLTESSLGDPSNIIIHTGTNDLRAQQERVAESVRRVAQKASNTFPNSRITLSTLLPRTDFHPMTIQRINGEISRRCSHMPNVHLAHHPTLGVYELYDHVHLHKEMVGVFAKTLKDVALGRSLSSSPPRSSREPYGPHASRPYPSPPPRRPTAQHASRPYPSPPPRRPTAQHPHHQPRPAPQHPDSGPSQRRPDTIPQAYCPAPHTHSPSTQQQQSYTAALKGPASSSIDLGEIRQLLNLIAAKLTS